MLAGKLSPPNYKKKKRLNETFKKVSENLIFISIPQKKQKGLTSLLQTLLHFRHKNKSSFLLHSRNLISLELKYVPI